MVSISSCPSKPLNLGLILGILNAEAIYGLEKENAAQWSTGANIEVQTDGGMLQRLSV